jgi:mannose-6-phosphate isomerase-like protein (cupin superfamily)/catechol 2,3-dioxygenase-like lactoylglutathione lyase family enzyme
MNETAVETREIYTEAGAGRAWWFLGTLAVLRNPPGAPRTPAVIELTVPPGGSPREHVHHSLDDSFLLLDGELAVRCGDQRFVARPGAYVVLPHGVPHTFRVTSAVPARMLLVHGDDSFLNFVAAIGTPTAQHTLPPEGADQPDPYAVERATAEHGAEMIGFSLEEDEAREILRDATPHLDLGAVNHLAVGVRDLRRSAQWYADVLDLVRADGEVAEDGTGHVTLVSPTGGWVLALASADRPEVAHVAITCAGRPALSARRAALAERGFEPGTITDAPYGSGFVVRDPDGLEVEFFAPA